MKIKTNELTGAALDWAVAQCGEWDGNTDADLLGYVRGVEGWTYSPSTDWSQGGPIIEGEGIALHLWSSEEWIGDMGDWEAKGPTPLIAAMRCFVASKFGDEVDVPEEIAQ